MFEEGIELRRIHGADKVFDLSLGNPILEPPPEFRTELMRIAQDETTGTHRYMPNGGFPETRAAVALELADETGLPFSGDDVMMTVGAAGALNVILRSILDQDDEVVLFAPFFAEYVFYVSHQGGQVKLAGCDEDFQPDPESLAAAITPRDEGGDHQLAQQPNRRSVSRGAHRRVGTGDSGCGSPLWHRDIPRGR